MIFIGLLSFAAPTLLWAVEALISRFASFSAARAVHAALLGVLLGIVVWQPLQDHPALAAIALVAVAVTVALLYLRMELVRNFALMLTVATPVVIVLFCASYPIRYEVLPGERAMAAQTTDVRTPVVMIVLDELPLSLLQNDEGGLDSELLPGLEKIESETTWYPRTLAVGDQTLTALPSIMTGEDADFNEERAPAGLPSYPDNVCSITAKAGYRVRAVEIVTDLCQRKSGLRTRMAELARIGMQPRSVALADSAGNPNLAEAPTAEDLTPKRLLEKGVEKVAAHYPSPPAVWAIERPGIMRNFNAGLDLKPGGFNFLHLLFPHAPYQFTENGQGYASFILGDMGSGLALERPTNIPESRKNMQQALAQTSYTLKLVGEVIDHMKAEGTWDESLFVLTADHGASFKLDAPRRTVVEDNEGWLLPVPLFIKYPGQEKGRVDRRFATSRDITPTVLDVLGLEPSAEATGHSLLGPPVPAPQRLDVTSQATDSLTVAPDEVEAQRQKATEFKAAAFGSGSLFTPGGKSGLIGSDAKRNAKLKPLEAEFASGGPEVEADPDGIFVPAYVQAELPGIEADPGTIAVAVNGKVAATTGAWERDGVWMTGVNVPASSYRKGMNDVELFAVRR